MRCWLTIFCQLLKHGDVIKMLGQSSCRCINVNPYGCQSSPASGTFQIMEGNFVFVFLIDILQEMHTHLLTMCLFIYFEKIAKNTMYNLTLINKIVKTSKAAILPMKTPEILLAMFYHAITSTKLSENVVFRITCVFMQNWTFQQSNIAENLTFYWNHRIK